MKQKIKKFQIVTLKNSRSQYEVVDSVPESRTRYILKDISRGEGYNETQQRCTGKAVKQLDGKGWMRGENYCYGQLVEEHIKNINL